MGSSQNGTSTIQQVKQVQKVLRVLRGGAAHSHMEAPRSFEYTLSLENKKPVNLLNLQNLESRTLTPYPFSPSALLI